MGLTNLAAVGGNTYAWTPATSLNDASTSNPTASPDRTTTYHVRVTNTNGCSTVDSIEVKVSTDNAVNGYLVPSVFTPNGDGRTDCFGVPFWGKVDAFSLSIYNRWGKQVFHSNQNSDCWDGTVKGKKVGTGSYVYLITAVTRCGTVQRKGSILLIR